MKRIFIFILSLLLVGCSNTIVDDTQYCIIEYLDNSIIVYPGFYERECHEEHSKDFVEMEVSNDCKFYLEDVTIVVKDEKEDKTIDFREITEDDIREAVEYDSAFVEIEYTKDKVITKMTLVSELIIWE